MWKAVGISVYTMGGFSSNVRGARAQCTCQTVILDSWPLAIFTAVRPHIIAWPSQNANVSRAGDSPTMLTAKLLGTTRKASALRLLRPKSIAGRQETRSPHAVTSLGPDRPHAANSFASGARPRIQPGGSHHQGIQLTRLVRSRTFWRPRDHFFWTSQARRSSGNRASQEPSK